MLGSLALAFVAGLVTILNPCVLPLVPIIIATAMGKSRWGPAALAGSGKSPGTRAKQIAMLRQALIAAKQGLGFMIMNARQLGEVGVIVFGIILIGIIGYGIDILMRMAEKWLVPWKGRG